MAGLLLEGAEVGRRKRRAARREEPCPPESGSAFRMRLQILQQPDVHGGHAHEGRGPLAFEGLHDPGRVEALFEEECESRQERAGDAEAEPVDVEEGESEHETVALREPPEIHHGAGVFFERAVRECDTLALAGRARGVDEHRDVVVGWRLGKEALLRRRKRRGFLRRGRGEDRRERDDFSQVGRAALIQDLVKDAAAVVARTARIARVAREDRDGPRVLEDVPGLVGLVPRVDRDVYDAGCEVSNEDGDQLGTGLREYGDAVAALDAERAQPVDIEVRETANFFEGEYAAVPDDCRLRRAGAQARQETRDRRVLLQGLFLFTFQENLLLPLPYTDAYPR